MTFRATAFILAYFLAARALAGDDTAAVYPSLSYSGSMSLSVSRVVYSSSDPGLVSDDTTYLYGAWLQSFGGGFGIAAELNRRFRVHFGLGGTIWHNIQHTRLGYYKDLLTRKAGGGLSAANGVLKIGDVDDPPLELTIGYFGFKYSDAENLGEYLLRSGVYPGYVFSGSGGAGFLGIRLHSDRPRNFTHDVIVSAETNVQPYGDISAAYVASYTIADAITLGAGVDYHRLVELDPEKTSSHYENKVPVYDDSATFATDTIRYKVRGVKGMGRLAIDPKPLIGLGDRDDDEYKVYAEAAVLGIEDQPYNTADEENRVGYEHISWRVPVMAGFNAPTHPLVANGLVPMGLSLFLIGMEADSVYFEDTDTVWR
ncbi:MAG: hypothetical protein GF418_17360, partial [Chitinivibrionales bacterium]|nr:hypothetical protein [Chitinivibrionales bacterium]MBD3397389.1 hypothetical protein [Chitinivibrionales bacterium]